LIIIQSNHHPSKSQRKSCTK